jgi:hypothetical protein
VIDLLFTDDDGQWVVVDYKTYASPDEQSRGTGRRDSAEGGAQRLGVLPRERCALGAGVGGRRSLQLEQRNP